MVFDIFTLILGETLEAGILISLLLTVLRANNASNKALYVGTSFGAVCAIIYGLNLATISNWLDYTGQEFINGSIKATVFFSLLTVAATLIPRSYRQQQILLAAVATTAAGIFTLEGAEITILYVSYWNSNLIFSAFVSGLVGMTVGLCLGIVIYHAIRWHQSWQGRIQFAICLLIGAGMALQSMQMFVQADYLEVGTPMWSSEFLLSESSLVGLFLANIIGYEATPTPEEGIIYGLATFAFLLTQIKRGPTNAPL